LKSSSLAGSQATSSMTIIMNALLFME